MSNLQQSLAEAKTALAIARSKGRTVIEGGGSLTFEELPKEVRDGQSIQGTLIRFDVRNVDTMVNSVKTEYTIVNAIFSTELGEIAVSCSLPETAESEVTNLKASVGKATKDGNSHWVKWSKVAKATTAQKPATPEAKVKEPA